MKIPYLRKKPELKSCHNVTWEDNYSWIHQENILEVLRDKDKLLPEVREYLEKENEYTDHHLNNTKTLQKDYKGHGAQAKTLKGVLHGGSKSRNGKKA